jgi:hypothetical protein
MQTSDNEKCCGLPIGDPLLSDGSPAGVGMLAQAHAALVAEV